MNFLKTLVYFIPFALFSVLVHLTGGAWAALAGLVAAVVIVATTARGGIKTLPALQAAILLVMALLAALGGASAREGVVQYGPTIAALLMGTFMLATAGTSPFTAQAARDSVPSRLWHDPRFLAVNRRTSTAWGIAVLVLGVCHLIGGALINTAPLVLLILINWGVPVVAMWRAEAYTKRTIDEAKTRMRAAHVDGPTAAA